MIEVAPSIVKNMKSTIEKHTLKGMSFSNLQNWCVDQGESRFRGIQLFEWMYQHGVNDPGEMSNIRKSFRDYLITNCLFETLSIEQISSSALEPTQKILFKTLDGLFIEAVSIIDGVRHTVCLSTQIGCNLKCDFCATGQMGLSRNLSSGEIVDQLIHVRKQTRQPITNIVFMGMGEPFLNYDNVMDAADIFHNQRGFDLASSRITISTAGILPKIEQFIHEKRKFKLAISLNAPDDVTRSKIMPVNNKWSIQELIRAGRAYSKMPRREVMFEYVLLKGFNDSEDDAMQLARLLKGIECKINIIPYNASGGIYKRPDEQTVNEFAKVLSGKRDTYRVLVRRSKGEDIEAACGQLATKSQENAHA